MSQDYYYSDSGSEYSDSDNESEHNKSSAAASKSSAATASKTTTGKAFLARQKTRQSNKAHFVQHNVAEHVLNPAASIATISEEKKQTIEKRMIKAWFKDSTNVGRWRVKFTTIQAAEALSALDPDNVQKKQDVEYLKSLLADRRQEVIKLEQKRQAAQERQAAQAEFTRLNLKHDMKSLGKVFKT